MRLSAPFSRSLALFHAIAAAMQLPLGARDLALAQIPAYVSRGKGGKRPHRSVGTKAYQRAACKARNVQRNRKAHRA